MQQISDILSNYCAERSNLIPILNEVQSCLGYLSSESMQSVANYFGMSASEVYGVATFYAVFKFKPGGRHCVKACRGTACHVKGAKRVLGELEKQLGIKPGETTPDMGYSLETVACTGACSLAPVVILDDEPRGEMTPKKVGDILSGADERV
jgi:NADH:ubiquinone oxidoreductase subunit E